MAAHSGSNVWTTNLIGYYNNYENGYITSPVINLSAYSGSGISFNWWQWFTVESGYDYISVEASNNGGSTWTAAWGPSYGSTTGSWLHPSATITTAYAVSNLRVRFHFHSDSSVVFDGWYVDDVVLGTPGSTTPACEP